MTEARIGELSGVDVAVIGVYLLALLLSGLFFAPKIANDAAFSAAGRRLKTGAIGFSVFAAWVGLAGLFGTPENVFKFGLSGMWWFYAWLPGAVLMAYLLAVRLRKRLYMTLPELVAEPGGGSARVMAALVVSWNYVAWVAVQVFALGMIFGMFTTLNHTQGTIIAFLVVVAYTLCGGLPAVVATSVLQAGIMLLLVVVVAPVLVAVSDNGWSNVFAATGAIEDYHSLVEGAGWRTVLVWGLSLLPAAFIDPASMQRVFGASEPTVARRGVYLGAGLYLVFGLALTGMGMAARVMLPGTDPRYAMPAILYHLLPAGLLGLAIVVFLSAAMSTASAALLVVATTLQRDVVAHLRPRITEKERLLVSRFLILLVGGGALGIALLSKSVVDILLMGFTVYVPGLLLPVLAASFRWRVAPWCVQGTMLAGVLGAVAWLGIGEPGIPAIAAGLLASALPFAIGLGAGARRAEASGGTHRA